MKLFNCTAESEPTMAIDFILIWHFFGYSWTIDEHTLNSLHSKLAIICPPLLCTTLCKVKEEFYLDSLFQPYAPALFKVVLQAMSRTHS